jgi:hypothetical protein
MRTLLVQLQNRRTELLTRYTPTDRLVGEVDQEIADTSNSLKAALAQKGQEDTTDVNPAWQGVKSSLVEGSIDREALLGARRKHPAVPGRSPGPPRTASILGCALQRSTGTSGPGAQQL